MQTRPDVLILVALPLVILFTLAISWFLGVPKSNLLFLIPAMSLSIMLLLSLSLNFFGSCIFFETLEFPFHNNLFSYVTIKVQFFWAPTPFLTNGQACWVRLALSSWTCCYWQTLHSVHTLSLTGWWYLHQKCTSVSFSIFSLQAPHLF